ncbi:MAG: DinB family protein [Actinomycetota bacterium]
MNGAILKHAFAHHVWATDRLLEACGTLSPPQLETAVPGTYGSILDTARHLVVADSWYLFVLSGEVYKGIEDESQMTLVELRDAIVADGAEWSKLLQGDLDPDAVLIRNRPDGSETHAPIGIRLGQVLHHGTDHRSQICTALTTLGYTPPDIDTWDFGAQAGTVTQIPPTSG